MSAADQLAVLAEDTALTGRMSGQDVTVLGQFEGDLQLRGVLRIGRKGRVKAVVRARAVEVEGEFDGEIRAASLVFGETARAKGTFLADRLSIREGALVDGAVNLSTEPAPREAPPVSAAPPAPPAPEPNGAGGTKSPDGAEPGEPQAAAEPLGPSAPSP
jgi:cytoskeletal protein CcmA (bactofilin family)